MAYADPSGGRSPAAPTPPDDTRTSSTSPRIVALDILRGFALCGILLANIEPIAAVGEPVIDEPAAEADIVGTGVGLAVHHRFFPMFSLLFGIGFSLLLESTAERTARPRLVLLRRLAVLLVLGLLHTALWPGDILTIYAAVGVVVLLPSTWLPRRLLPALAVAFLAASPFVGGVTFVAAGLFLLGSALTRFGVVARMERSTRVPAVLGLAFAVGAVPAVWAQMTMDGAVGAAALTFAGLMVAGVYWCGILLLLHTPLRGVLHTVFAPLGRMALTNYLGATVLVLAAVHGLGLAVDDSGTAVVITAGAILAAQWLLSALWLRRYRMGPVECLWRWATWWRRPQLRAVRTPGAAAGVVAGHPSE